MFIKPKNKIFSEKTLAILTGSGNTPALNPGIESVRNRVSMSGYKVYGIRKGWKGLPGNGDIIDLTNHPYDCWYGGTALSSVRTNPFPTKKNPENRVSHIIEKPEITEFKYDFPVVLPGN